MRSGDSLSEFVSLKACQVCEIKIEIFFSYGMFFFLLYDYFHFQK